MRDASGIYGVQMGRWLPPGRSSWACEVFFGSREMSRFQLQDIIVSVSITTLSMFFGTFSLWTNFKWMGDWRPYIRLFHYSMSHCTTLFLSMLQAYKSYRGGGHIVLRSVLSQPVGRVFLQMHDWGHENIFAHLFWIDRETICDCGCKFERFWQGSNQKGDTRSFVSKFNLQSKNYRNFDRALLCGRAAISLFAGTMTYW